MKKTLLFIFAVVMVTGSFAQKKDKERRLSPQKYSFSANVGGSAAGGLIRIGVSSLVDKYVKLGVVSTFSTPALQANFEYKITPKISLGAAYSYQSFSAEYTGWVYKEGIIFDMGIKLKRANYAARVFYHYGNFKKADIYSGVRLGYTIWSLTANVHTPNINASEVVPGVNQYLGYINFTLLPGVDYETPKVSFGIFAPQLVLFGYRYYFNDYIGLNAELTFGAPHFISAGLVVRF